MATLVFKPTDNVYISEYYPDQNYAGSSYLYCGQFSGSGDIYRSLLHFDLSSIPASCTINEAKLKLYIFWNTTPAVSRHINVFSALGSFSQDTVTWANQPLIGDSPESSITVDSQLNTYVEFDVVNMVRGWYTGSIPNNGIVMTGLETDNAMVGFISKYFNNSSYWPLLEVSYVKGVNIEYPVETVTTSTDWVGSTAIPLGPRTMSFAVVNTGPNDAAVGMEISPDGLTWMWVAFLITSGVIILAALPPSGYTGDSSIVFNTSGYTGAYVRISYTCRTGYGPTTLDIYPTATEV
ncbi:MAG: DNRLRE domain-containing protein [Syntrophomonadaceae bacterium]